MVQEDVNGVWGPENELDKWGVYYLYLIYVNLKNNDGSDGMIQ